MSAMKSIATGLSALWEPHTCVTGEMYSRYLPDGTLAIFDIGTTESWLTANAVETEFDSQVDAILAGGQIARQQLDQMANN